MKTELNAAKNPLLSPEFVASTAGVSSTHKDETLADPNSMLSTMHMTRVMMEAETSPTQYTDQHESSADYKQARDDQNPLRVPLINSNEQQAFSVISSEQNLLSSKTQIFLQQTGLNLEDLQRANISLAFLEEMLNKSLSKRLLRWLALDSTLSKATLFPFLDERGIQNEEIAVEQLACKATLQKYFSTRVWIKGKSLPFKSERMIGRAYGVDSFYDGVEAVITRVWSLMLASFLANDFYNYYNYPDERYGATPSQIFFNQGDNEQALVTYLSRPEHWYGFVAFLGIPFSFGIIKAIYASYCIPRTLNAEKIAELTNFFTDPHNLNSENSNVLKAAWNWFSPFSKSPKLLETTREALLWNNQLTSEQRTKLYRDFQNYLRHSHKFAQLNSLGILSYIAGGMARGDFIRLARLGVEPPLLLSLLANKMHAFQELQEMAKNYHLPSEQQDNSKYGRFVKPLVRYLFAHYCLWSIGHSQSNTLQPFFWGFKATKFYVKTKFAVLIYQGIAAAIALSQRKKDCLDDGKVWQFINEIEDYNCTICSDFPIPYPYTFTMQSCILNFLRTTRDAYEIIKLFNRIQLRDNITLLDLSQQHFPDINGINNLTQIMPIIQKRIPTLKQFLYSFDLNSIVNKFRLGRVGIQAIADFLPKSTLEVLSLSQNYIDARGATAIASVLPNSTLTTLYLAWNKIGANGTAAIASVLHGSNLRLLDLSSNNLHASGAAFISSAFSNSMLEFLDISKNNIGNNGAKAIGSALNNSKLEILYLNNNKIGDIGAKAISSTLANANLQLLDLSDNDISDDGATAIGSVLRNSKLSVLYLDSNNIRDDGATAISCALANSDLRLLDLSSNNMNARGIIAIGSSLPYSRLQNLRVADNGIDDYGAEGISYGLFNSSLLSLDLTANDIGFSGASAISAALHYSKLQALYFGDNQVSINGAIEISFALTNSNLSILQLNGNGIGDTGADAISNALPSSGLQYLDLSNNDISDCGAIAIGSALPKSSLQSLFLNGNRIADNGTIAIGFTLPYSRLQNLYINSNDIGALGATAIGSALSNANVQLLDLSHNYIGDSGGYAIGSALSSSVLKSLDLSYNGIGDNAAKRIANALVIRPKQIHHSLWINLLDPSDKPILETIKPSGRLTHLALYANNITNTGAKSLCEILPWTHIPTLDLVLNGNNIDQSIIHNGSCVTSNGFSLRPATLNFALPFIVLFYFICHVLSFTGSAKESKCNTDSRLKTRRKPKETPALKDIITQPTVLLQQKMEVRVERLHTAHQEKPKVLSMLPQYSSMVNEAVVLKNRRSTSNPNKTVQEHVIITVEQKTAKEQYALGLELLYGKNIKRDPAHGIELLISSAKLGNLEAMYEIGDCYLSGTGFKQNDKKAAEWFGLAARSGYDEAQLQMGYLCEGGYGIKKDKTMAIKWFTMAADAGNVKARFELTDAVSTVKCN